MILDRNIIKNFEQNKEIEASKEIISASMAKSLTENYWKDKGLDFKGQILDSIFYNINNAIQEGIPYCTFKNDKLNKNYIDYLEKLGYKVDKTTSGILINWS